MPHRYGGPAISYDDGDQYWFQHDELHRDGGPAVIYANGDQYWYKNGKQHRDDGPASINVNGDQEWYQHGKNITDTMKKWISARGIDANNLSDKDKKEIKRFMATL